MNVKKLTTMAMLTAISMIVFLIEAQIPLPIAIPGVKLGVANVITLFAIWTLGRREAGVILLIRIVLGNLIVGSVMAMLYSLAGGLLCWVIMCLMKPITSRKHIWVMSIFGNTRSSGTTWASWRWRFSSPARCPLPSMPRCCSWRGLSPAFHRPVRPGRAEPYGQACASPTDCHPKSELWLTIERRRGILTSSFAK